VAGTQQAVRADFDASVRQDLVQETTHELFGPHRTVARLRRGRVLVLQCDVAFFELQDTVSADGDPKDVRSAIPEGLLATADRLTVHDPVLLPDVGIQQRKQGGLVPWNWGLGSEQPRERLHVDQAVLPGGQPPAIASHAASRNAVVHVKMGAQITGPGMPHAHQTDPAPNAPALHRSCLYGLGGTLQQDGVETRLALSGGFRRITAARDARCGLPKGPGDASWPAPRADGLITLHIIKHMLNIALHRWPPVGVRDRGGPQWTPSAKSTTLESNMSLSPYVSDHIRVPDEDYSHAWRFPLAGLASGPGRCPGPLMILQTSLPGTHRLGRPERRLSILFCVEKYDVHQA